MVLGAMQQRMVGWRPVNERMCRLRIRGRFFNLSIINVHTSPLGSTYDENETIYTQLDKEYDRCPKHDVKFVIGDLNAQVGQKEAYKPTIGSFTVFQHAHRLTQIIKIPKTLTISCTKNPVASNKAKKLSVFFIKDTERSIIS